MLKEGFREIGFSIVAGFAMAEMEDIAGGALAESDGLRRREAISLDSGGAWSVVS